MAFCQCPSMDMAEHSFPALYPRRNLHFLLQIASKIDAEERVNPGRESKLDYNSSVRDAIFDKGVPALSLFHPINDDG